MLRGLVFYASVNEYIGSPPGDSIATHVAIICRSWLDCLVWSERSCSRAAYLAVFFVGCCVLTSFRCQNIIIIFVCNVPSWYFKHYSALVWNKTCITYTIQWCCFVAVLYLDEVHTYHTRACPEHWLYVYHLCVCDQLQVASHYMTCTGVKSCYQCLTAACVHTPTVQDLWTKRIQPITRDVFTKIDKKHGFNCVMCIILIMLAFITAVVGVCVLSICVCMCVWKAHQSFIVWPIMRGSILPLR